MAVGDTWVEGDYNLTIMSEGSHVNTVSAKVVDKTKSSYDSLASFYTHNDKIYTLINVGDCFQGCDSLVTPPSIPSTVTWCVGCFRDCSSMTTAPALPDGITNMGSMFSGCSSLMTAPVIPDSVTEMGFCFQNCTSLITAPVIPSGVTNMYYCFNGCTALTTASTIPSTVEDISGCFSNCISLTGDIVVGGNPTNYSYCFRPTILPINLLVSQASEFATWKLVAATSTNNNVNVVYIGSNPAPTAVVTAYRVSTNDPTDPDSVVPNENGLYVYIQVETTISTDEAPDNVADIPIITIDGLSATVTGSTGTASWHGWVTLTDELKHTIGATPRDLYKTGTEITVTLVPAYSPMEFYQGGTGASFGMHATRAGWLDVAWNMDVDGSIECADGNPYCSDGTNVVVGGTTVGSADNLSYVVQDPANGTLTKDATYFTWDTASSLKRWGRLCNVGVLGNLKSALPRWTSRTIGTVSPAPLSTTWFWGNSNTGKPVLFQINSDGTLAVRALEFALTSGDDFGVRGSTVYICGA